MIRSTSQPSPPESQFAPSFAAAYTSPMPETAGERRVVSALIADVAGSTAIGEQLGPERSKLLFDDVVQLMREQVERFGGTVAQLTGDGVLALFGAPTAHEDDSERAVRAALALHESVARYAAERLARLRDRACSTRGGQHGAGGRPLR